MQFLLLARLKSKKICNVCSDVFFYVLGQKAAASELSTTGAIATEGRNLNSSALSRMDQQSNYAKIMAEIPQLAELGQLFKSSAIVSLTESEEEYQINCIKHVFPQHFVFQVSAYYIPEKSSLNAEIH